MAPQFGQSPVALGGGLKNWRPLSWWARMREAARWWAATWRLAANDQIADFSLVQYQGTEPSGDGATRFVL